MNLFDSLGLFKSTPKMTNNITINDSASKDTADFTEMSNYGKFDEANNGAGSQTKSLPGLPRSPKTNEVRGRRSGLDVLSSIQASPSKGKSSVPEQFLVHSAGSLSTQVEVDGRSPTPTSDLRSASRDNESHFDGNIGNSSFSIPYSSTPSFQPSDGMEDIMIHRYLVEKNKVKAYEAKNSSLQAYIQDLNMYILDQEVQFEREKNDSEQKIKNLKENVNTLEKYVKELEQKLSVQAENSKEQMKSMQLNAENEIDHIRQEGDTAMISLRKEIASLKTENATSRALLLEERENAQHTTKRLKEIDQLYQKAVLDYENQVTETNILQSRLIQMKDESAAAEDEQAEEIKNLKDALNNVNEMLGFKDEKGRELSDELKLMSYQYVDTVERLENEQAKTLRLSKELDSMEQKLKEQMKKNMSVTNQLEEISRGYIQMDKIHQMAKEKMKINSTAIQALKTELDREKEKSAQLSNELIVTSDNLRVKTDEVMKLGGVAACLCTERDSANSSLANVVSSLEAVTKEYNDSEKRYENASKMLVQKDDKVVQLTLELENATQHILSLSKDLSSTRILLDGTNVKIDEISSDLEEKKEALNDIRSVLEKERSENHALQSKNNHEIASLSQLVSTLTEEKKAQEVIVETLQLNLERSKDQCTRLEEALKEHTSDKNMVQATLEKEREAFREKSSFHQETIESLKKELNSLEQSHAALFDNLVETESKLQGVKEQLENANFQLMTKDAEFKPIEDMLKEEIMTKEETLKQEQEKSMLLSTQLLEANKKMNSMHTNLVSTEEKALKLEEYSKKIARNLSEKEKECKILSLNLEKEKNGLVQRKLKVAKKMIQAEKDRHRAILTEIDAKNLIIDRMEKQSETVLKELHEVKKVLEEEKGNKVTHSARALQQLYKQLEEERKTMRAEKEELRSKLQVERDTIKSMTERLNMLEGTSEIGENERDMSRVLKEHHENRVQIQNLLQENDNLKHQISGNSEKEELMKDKLSLMQNDVDELTKSMDTLTKYCRRLEEEKKLWVKAQQENARNAHISGDIDDDDTVDCRSLSDFSFAQVPSPRQTHRDILMKKTKIQESVHKEEQVEDDIEMTVDARILYDD